MCGQPRLNYVRVILHIQAEVRFTQCFSESRFMESLTVDQSRRRGLLLFDGRQDAECEERKQSNDDGNVVPSDEATAK